MPSSARRTFLLGSLTAVAALSSVLVAISRRLRPGVSHDARARPRRRASPRFLPERPAQRLAAGRRPREPRHGRPGTRPELTANATSIASTSTSTPPTVDAASWRLEIGGLVAKPLALTLDELRARPAISQIITLECISNPVGGDLIGTSRWTGVRSATCSTSSASAPTHARSSFEAADGFYESAALEDARDPRALLVYEMNGEPLTAEHGFPLRLYIPNRHGMKLPKWITRIELVATPTAGLLGRARLERDRDPAHDLGDRHGPADRRRCGAQLSVGGIAYAGARGSRAVEVQIDDGPWQPAQLRRPRWPADLGAVAVRLAYRAGPHTFRVRAYDGTGAARGRVQPPHPDGATGLHELAAKV